MVHSVPWQRMMIRPTVVVVSDHPLVLDRVRAMLESAFDTISLMAHPESVVATVSAIEPLLVVVDASAGSLKGWEVLKRVREELPTRRMIAVTDDIAPADLSLLPSNVPVAEGLMALSPKIREVLGGGPVVDEPPPMEAPQWVRRYSRNYCSPPESCCER